MQPRYYGAAAEYNKPKGGLFSGRLLLIVGATLVGLLIIIVVFAILGSIASGPRNEVARLAARAQQLQGLLEADLKEVKDPNLKKVSAETKLYLGTSSLALLNAYGDKLPEGIVASEADAAVTSRLADATKAGKHDEVFLEIMTAKVNSILELSQKIQVQTNGQKTRAATAQLTNDMALVIKQLDSISF